MAHSLNILNEGLDSLFESVEECCICGKPIDGEGNNAEPVYNGYCCDECNMTVVVPARLQLIKKQHGEVQEEYSEDDAKKLGAAIGTAGGIIAGQVTPGIVVDDLVMGAAGGALGNIAGDVAYKIVNRNKQTTNTEEDIAEDFDTVRPNHDKLLGMLEDGLVSYKTVCQACLYYMSDDEIADLMHEYELDDVDMESLKEADDEQDSQEETPEQKMQREWENSDAMKRHKAWMADMHRELYGGKVKAW